LAKIFEQLGTSEKGLTALEAKKRLEAYGYEEVIYDVKKNCFVDDRSIGCDFTRVYK